jgi:catechol 2,3-dioxygenase-like lactoylglutathione lyase family enzyme
MQVEALDHVNIIAADLARSAAFYADVLGLEERAAPAPLTPETARWMYDAGGHAVIHLNSLAAPRAYPRDMLSGPTGALHHVALRCTGHDAIRARLEGLGIDHSLNDIAAVGLRQIFVADPDGVLLELNFFA